VTLKIYKKYLFRGYVHVATVTHGYQGRLALNTEGVLNLDDPAMKVIYNQQVPGLAGLYKILDLIGNMKGYQCELVYET
jgi:hypothetical protein